jgi:hypothetical protein
MESLRSACLATPVARRSKSLNLYRHRGSPFLIDTWHTIVSVGRRVGDMTIRRSPTFCSAPSWSCRCCSLAMF